MPEGEFRRELEVKGAKILHVRRIGTSNLILITVEGTTPSRYALYSRLVMRMHLYRPRSLPCVQCYKIGHRADVFPNETSIVTCPKYSTNLPLQVGLDPLNTCGNRTSETARESTRRVRPHVRPVPKPASKRKRETTPATTTS